MIGKVRNILRVNLECLVENFQQGDFHTIQ